MRIVAMVLAGGRGSRVATEVNKVFLSVHDRVMLDYPLETFHLAEQVDEIVVVSRREDDERLRQLLGSRSGKPVRVVTGGASRHESEIAGIESLAGPIEAGEIELVAIHDGARPFMTLDLLEACINTARRLGGAIPGLPPESPLYRLTGNGALPLDESALIRAQTPQVFEAKALLGAYRASVAGGFEGVDTAETIEKFGILTVGVVPGDERNVKITFVEDLFRAEELAGRWRHGRWV